MASGHLAYPLAGTSPAQGNPRSAGTSRSPPGNASVFLDALEQVRLAAAKYEKTGGLLVPDGAAASAKIAEGWTFVTIGSDSALLATAATAQLARGPRPR